MVQNPNVQTPQDLDGDQVSCLAATLQPGKALADQWKDGVNTCLPPKDTSSIFELNFNYHFQQVRDANYTQGAGFLEEHQLIGTTTFALILSH